MNISHFLCLCPTRFMKPVTSQPFYTCTFTAVNCLPVLLEIIPYFSLIINLTFARIN